MGFLSDLLSALQPAARRSPGNGLGLTAGVVRVSERGDSWSAPIAPGTTGEIMGYVVPCRMRLRYQKVGNYLGQTAGWGFASWEVLKNGVLVLRIRDQIGYAAQREFVSPIDVSGGDRFSVNGINPTAGALDMGITLKWDEESVG